MSERQPRGTQTIDRPEVTTPEEIDTSMTNAEILGRSYQVRLAVNEGIGKKMGALKTFEAHAKNTLSTPKNIYLEHRYEAALNRAARREARLGSSNFGFINKIHENRHKKATEKLSARTKAFNDHTGMMEGRTRGAQEYVQGKEAVHQKRVEMLRDRKLLAEGRKEIRRLKRERRAGGANREQVRSELNALGVEGMKRYGAIACATETAKRETKRVERQRQRAANKEARLDRGLTDLMEETEDKRELQTSTRESLGSLRETADETRTEADSIREQLEDPDLPEDERAALEDQLARVEETLREIDEAIREQSDKLRAINDEVRQLSRKIEQHNEKIRAHSAQVAEIDDAVRVNDAANADLNRRIIAQRTDLQQHTHQSERNQ